MGCSNGGTCVDGVNSFTCTCASGWKGATCDVADGMMFGMYDFSRPGDISGDGWSMVETLNSLADKRHHFVEFYNANGGIPAIRNWKSSNCCFSLKDHSRLTVDGDFAIPHQSSYRCNINPHYSGTYKFIGWYARHDNSKVHHTLSMSQPVFSSKENCASRNNPAIY